MATDEGVDGRVQRSVRSRKSIVDAMVSLVEEGDLLPTGERVARRAGVGLRTVFRHFEDMEALYGEMHQIIEAMVRPLAGDPLSEGEVDERISALVVRRAALFERMAPFQRSGRLQRWHSEFLQARHASFVRDLRADLRACVPEVSELSPELRAAVEQLSSFEAWDRLRVDQRLSVPRSRAAVRKALLQLVRCVDR